MSRKANFLLQFAKVNWSKSLRLRRSINYFKQKISAVTANNKQQKRNNEFQILILNSYLDVNIKISVFVDKGRYFLLYINPILTCNRLNCSKIS